MDTAHPLESLGVTQHDLGDYQAAQESKKEPVAFQKKLLGEYVHTARSLHSLGMTQHKIGDYQASLESEREAVAIQKKLFGEHVEAALPLHEFGVTQHSEFSQPEERLAVFKKSPIHQRGGPPFCCATTPLIPN